MRLRRMIWLPLAALLLIPALAVAGGQPAAKAPSVVVRVRSIDALLELARYGAGLVGQGDMAEQIEQMIKLRAGDKGLEGIDLKRPIGVYGLISKDFADVSGVVMLPVAGEKALLDLLNSLNVPAEKGEGGLYSVKVPNIPVPVFFRFANRYAYVTALKSDAIDKANLLLPQAVFGESKQALVSTSVRLDQIPDAIKGVILDQIDLKMAEAIEKNEPNETKAVKALRVKLLEEFAVEVKTLVRDGGAVEAVLDVNLKTKKITVEASLKGKAGSKLAKQITGLATEESLFTSVAAGSALGGLVHFTIPEKLREQVAAVFEEGFSKGLKQENDAEKRKHAERLIKALSPAIKAGELDVGFGIRGPGKGDHFTALIGVKVKDANELSQTVTELLKEALKAAPEAERAKFKLDAFKIGDVAVHRFEVQSTYDEHARKAFGDHPLLMAFSDKALLLAIGPDAAEALKKALSATSAPAPLAHVEVNLGQLIKASPLSDADRNLARKTLNGDAGVISFTFRGGPSMSIRLDAHLGLVQFFAEKHKGAFGGDQ